MARRLYRGVDYLWVRLPEVAPFFAFLTQTLRLPVSWPLQDNPTGSFGRVALGNITLELWSSTSALAADSQAEFCGLALDPENMQTAINSLDRLGIPCKLLRPFEVVNAQSLPVARVTNAVLMHLSGPECSVFLSEWQPLEAGQPWYSRAHPASRRQRDQRKLEQSAGGALGVTGLVEIEIETPDFANAEGDWRQLTGSTGNLQLADDIALRLVHGNATRIRSLTVAVRSLAAAREFLAAQRMLGDDTGSALLLSRRMTSGLNFRLVEAQIALPLAWPELAYA